MFDTNGSSNTSRWTQKAFEMLVTGQFIEAKEAKEIGLINKVSKIGKLEETADELALQIASKLGDAVKTRERGILQTS